MNQIAIVRSIACLFIAAVVGTSLSGCANRQKAVLESEESQVKSRSIQSRAFDTTDVNKMMRTTIATLQDLSFVVDSADQDIGTVTATKLDGYQLRITVSIRPRGQTQLLVRANAQYQVQPVKDPKPYQDFFTALEKAMFLTAHQVD